MRLKRCVVSCWASRRAVIRPVALAAALGAALPAPLLHAAPATPPTPQAPPTAATPAQPTQPSEPAAPSQPPQPLPAYPDLTSDYTSMSILKSVVQNFTGKIKRHGRKIYLEEQSTSSGPIGYNEYFIYDLEKNFLYRILRDEQVYFESELSIDQRVEAIRKGWVPAEGIFTFNTVNITLSSHDTLLRPDIVDKRSVELRLREITAEIPAIGTVAARTIKYYSFVWVDPNLSLPVKISYSVNLTHSVVEYHNIVSESVDPSLFDIPKDYADLTPY
jgi:hypothetical protein